MAARESEKEEHRKNQIIQAAFAVIATNGYNNFTIEDIANQAGLSKGGVLHYFKTKEDILIYLLERGHADVEKNIKIITNKYITPEKIIKALIISIIKSAKNDPAFFLVWVDFLAHSSVNERIRYINTKIFNLMYDKLKEEMETGINLKIFNPKINPSHIAYAVTNMILNIGVQWAYDNTIYNINSIARSCLSMVMSYLKKTG
jgi:AcrR family transcriptional regulator